MNQEKILRKVTIIEGKKSFGQFNSLIKINPEAIILNRIESSEMELSIIIPVFYRFNRLFVALNCLLKSIKQSSINMEIIILDNSLAEANLINALHKFFQKKQLPLNVKYYHNPLITHCELRNIGVQLSSLSSTFLCIMDSDVYFAKDTISRIIDCFKVNNNIQALSPAVAPYSKGSHNDCRSKFPLINKNGSQNGLLTPTPYYVEHGNWINDELLEIMVLWRIYFIRKKLLNLFPDPMNPWLIDFVAWQNVPLFLTIKEANHATYCLSSSDILCLHDERPNSFTVGNSMSNWQAETIKSILMIFYRNKLYLPEQQRINVRFITNMESMLADKFDKNAKNIIKILFKMSGILEMDFNNGKKELLKLNLPHDILATVINLIIFSEQTWNRIKKIRSLKLNQPI